MTAKAFDPNDADRYAELEITVAGKTVLAHRLGAVVLSQEKLLVVADLHFEKGSAQAERGSYLPPYDTRTTLGRLAEVIGRYDPDTVVALGDSFHDPRAAERLALDDLEAIADLQAGRDWIWITGNHDPSIPRQLGGSVLPELAAGGFVLRHEPRPGSQQREMAGHLHPAARLSRQGYSLRRPCFFSGGKRLVLPAFGAFTGGLNVLDPAFSPLMAADGFRIWMTGHEGVYPVPTAQLRGD